MAGRRLEFTIVLSRAGGLALAVVAALAGIALANIKFMANSLVFYTLIGGAIQWGAYLLFLQVRWLCLGGEQPGHVALLVLIAVEWAVAWLTIGTACAAITVDLFALQHHYHYCTAGAACVLYLAAAAMACAAGSLAAVSALGMLWILGSQFRPAQAP